MFDFRVQPLTKSLKLVGDSIYITSTEMKVKDPLQVTLLSCTLNVSTAMKYLRKTKLNKACIVNVKQSQPKEKK